MDKKPAVGEKGRHHKECTICGKELECEDIDALQDEEPFDPSEPSGPEKEGCASCGAMTFTGGGRSGLGGMLIMLMLIVPLVLLPIRKKKQSNR